MSNLFDSASLVMIPSGYKATKLYSIKPTDGTGDFTVARASVASRINEDLLIENMAANVPRINYPSCPSVLLEPARTNLITYPVSFDNAYWGKTGATIDDNGGAGYDSPHADYPSGALKLVESAIDEPHYIRRTSITVVGGSDYIFSFYIEAGERTKVGVYDGYGGSWFSYDLSTDSVIDSGAGASNVEAESGANGFIRLSYRFVGHVANLSRPSIYLLDDNYISGLPSSYSYTGDGTSGLYIFGAQLEEGTYPTSFIYDGTEGATVNRALDAVNGATYSGDSESGVLFVDVSALVNDSSTRLICLSNNTLTSVVRIGFGGASNLIQSRVIVGGTTVCNLSFTPTDITVAHKVAIRWAVDDFSLWADGSKIVDDLSGITFGAGVLTQVQFSNGDGSTNPFYGECKELIALPYLTDAEMASLTT